MAMGYLCKYAMTMAKTDELIGDVPTLQNDLAGKVLPTGDNLANDITESAFKKLKAEEKIKRIASQLHDIGATSAIAGGGIGAAGGAGIGALLGGEDRSKGALLGALLGAGAGSIGSAMLTSGPTGDRAVIEARNRARDLVSKFLEKARYPMGRNN